MPRMVSKWNAIGGIGRFWAVTAHQGCVDFNLTNVVFKNLPMRFKESGVTLPKVQLTARVFVTEAIVISLTFGNRPFLCGEYA
jgi:hypothetical protein